MAAQNLSQRVFSIRVDAIFRKIEISKKSYDVHFIFIYILRISLVFYSRYKIATGRGPAEEAVQKNGFVCERFCATTLFSKNVLKFVHVP